MLIKITKVGYPMKNLLCTLCVLLLWLISPFSFASTIKYQAIDLTDTGTGDLWQYHYQISDRIFQVNDGFNVLFAPTLYKGLDNNSISPNGDWDVISLQPDPFLPDPGRLDGLALVNSASLSDMFTINFIWLGAGKPGSQPFEIYSLASNGNIGAILETGQTSTSVVPVPGALVLFVSGLLGLAYPHSKKGVIKEQ